MKVEKNAITKEMIEGWKAKYGHVYKTLIGSEPVIWRKLKRSEYVDIMTSTADEDDVTRVYHRQEEMVKKTALYPENIDELVASSAGVATNVSEEILIKSGFEIASTEEL